jgi:two-component system sensor histidine kinase DegS
MRKHLEGEAPAYEVRYRLRTDSGEWRWFWDRGRIVERGKNGEPVRVTGMVRDITELKELETAYLSLAARVTSAQEDERARISRELHDGVGQDLAAIKLKSHNLAETIESSDPYKALREAGELIEIAQGSLEELRRIVYDLRPPALDDLDFMQVLEWLCVRVKRHFGIVVRPRLAVDQNKCLSLHKTVVFRVVQEALHNCAQHAGVECVDLRLENDDDELVVEVIDKGKGFDIKTTPQGVGLSGMRDRVESLGGRFRIESATGAGTKVHAKIPLKLGRDFV